MMRGDSTSIINNNEIQLMDLIKIYSSGLIDVESARLAGYIYDFLTKVQLEIKAKMIKIDSERKELEIRIEALEFNV